MNMNNSEVLAGFYGTSTWWKFGHPTITFTDGFKFLFDNYKVGWMLGPIIEGQKLDFIKKEGFQVWKIIKDEEVGFKMIMEDGNNNLVYSTFIEEEAHKDVTELTVWFINNVVLLPSEY